MEKHILKHDYDHIKTKLNLSEEHHYAFLEDAEDLFFRDLSGIIVSNSGGWHSEYMPISEETEFFNKVMQIAQPTIEYLRFRDNMKATLSMNVWYNYNTKSDTNNPHCHLNRWVEDKMIPFLSGVYYLKKPQNSGDLRFTSERSYLKKVFYCEMHEVVEAEEGDLILFYPHMMHSVGPNLTDDFRISMAFNIILHIDK